MRQTARQRGDLRIQIQQSLSFLIVHGVLLAEGCRSAEFVSSPGRLGKPLTGIPPVSAALPSLFPHSRYSHPSQSALEILG